VHAPVALRPRALIAIVAMLALNACSSSKPSANDSAMSATPSSVLEQQRLDLDGDGVPDDITVTRLDTSSASKTGRIDLRMSKAGAHTLQDTVATAPDEFNGNGNLVKSRLVYVADFDRAGRLMMLFGALEGCCQQSLTIYRLGPTGPEPYFHAAEFFVDRSPIPQPGKVATIAGRRLSTAAASPSSEYISSVTYAPVVAYRLEETPRIDSTATKALTREELGGFAGFEPRADIAALRKRDGSKVLWNLREHRAMP